MVQDRQRRRLFHHRFASRQPTRCASRASGFALFESMQMELTAARALTVDAKLTIADRKTRSHRCGNHTSGTRPLEERRPLVLTGQDLDMLSDDPDDLQNDLMALAGPAAGPNGGQIFVDGFSNGQLPPKDSIREIRVNSNPFSAEFDHIGFGRIEILTKPGTDKLHGSIFYQTDSGALDARNPFATQKPSFLTQAVSGQRRRVYSARRPRSSWISAIVTRTIRRWSKPPFSSPDFLPEPLTQNVPDAHVAAFPEPAHRLSVGRQRYLAGPLYLESPHIGQQRRGRIQPASQGINNVRPPGNPRS